MPPDSCPARRSWNATQPDKIQQLQAARQPFLLGQTAHLGKETDVLQDGQIFIQREALRQVTDLAASLLTLFCERITTHNRRARIRLERTHQQSERGGLAGTIRTDQPVDLAGFTSG